MTVGTRIQLRRDSAGAWTAANPVLASGEQGIETDTQRLKRGDGVTAWNALPYVFDNVAASVAFQPLSTDLTTIAGLSSVTAGALGTDGSGWVRKTYAQLKAALGLVKADVGLGSADNTSDASKPVSTAQQAALNAKLDISAASATFQPRQATLLPALPVPLAGKITQSGGQGTAVGWMSTDGLTIYNIAGSWLNTSTDEGVTYTSIHDFAGSNIQGVRELDNGELIVSVIFDQGLSTQEGRLWLSSGWAANPATATWTKVLTASAVGALGSYFTGAWGLKVDGARIVATEYGDQNVPNNSTHVWLSQDHGATWTAIYANNAVNGSHLHGGAPDPYWDQAIWVTTGDGSSYRQILLSLDNGATWRVVSTAYQATGIVCLPGCVLFTTDSAPNGVLRYDRANGKTSTTVDVAYRFNTSGTLTHVGQQAFTRGNGYPVLLSFTTAGSGNSGKLLLTSDGFSFTEVWSDTITYANKGLYHAVGPTPTGRIIGDLTDGRYANPSRLSIEPVTYDVQGIATLFTPSQVGAWYVSPLTRGGVSVVPTLNELVLDCPMFSGPDGVTLDQFAEYLSAAGSAGAVARMGVYLPRNQAKPFQAAAGTLYADLLIDLGTVATDTGGNKVITPGTAVAIPPYTWFCKAVAHQVAAVANYYGANAIDASWTPLGGNNVAYAGGNTMQALTQSGVTGALPATCTPTGTTRFDSGVLIHRSA